MAMGGVISVSLTSPHADGEALIDVNGLIGRKRECGTERSQSAVPMQHWAGLRARAWFPPHELPNFVDQNPPTPTT